MRRRDLIILLGAAGALRPAFGQHKPPRVVGYLSGINPTLIKNYVDGLRQGLKDGGYIEGVNLTIDIRWTQSPAALPSVAAELVERKVDVIVTAGGDEPAIAASKATTTIPIVGGFGDPVEAGLVSSLSHPGGNVTGVSILVVSLHPKRLELLSELVPDAKCIGLLVNPNSNQTQRVERLVFEAAGRRGVELAIVTAGNEAQIDEAFATLASRNARALLIGADAYYNSRRDQLVALTARHAIPAIYYDRRFVVAGGLISYGVSLPAMYRQLGVYAGKILDGAKPADLPVEEPTKFELVLNRQTATTLGLNVPDLLLASADEIIE